MKEYISKEICNGYLPLSLVPFLRRKVMPSPEQYAARL
jgi:hypothetical protein